MGKIMGHHLSVVTMTCRGNWRLRSWTNVMLLLSATLLLLIPANGSSSLILQPGLARVLQNNLAVFNCSYSCTIRTNRTHTISWLVGDVNERLLVRGNEHVFTARSGLQVEVKDMSSDCPPDTKQPAMAIEQLIINGTSAELFNRTAVQCVAIPRSEDVATIYSSYSVMLIDIPVRVSPTPSIPTSPTHTESSADTLSVLPTPSSTHQCPAQECPTQECPAQECPTLECPEVQNVTITRNITVSLSPTSLPYIDPTCQDCIRTLCSDGIVTGEACSSSESRYMTSTWLLVTQLAIWKTLLQFL